jgi:dTDP-glucose 4,6-dehydratase
MRLLVTGGAGFIGSNFVRQTIATKTNAQVTILDALTYAGRLSNLSGLEGKYEFVHGDIRDSSVVDSLVSTSDMVIHFAAESHNDNSLQSPKPFIETNVMGTFELIQACVRHDVRFHHVSTDEVFGDLPLDGKDKFNRETPYNPSSPYSASKASSDHLVRAWVRSFGLKATISNCSNNFGPYQHEEKFIPRMIDLISKGLKPEIYGNGANVRDWIHVDDHNEGVWAVLERGKNGQTYLLGADNQRSNLQVVKALLDIMGKDQDFISFIMDRPGHDLRYAIDASATENELSWKPKHGNFEQKLEQTVTHYLDAE